MVYKKVPTNRWQLYGLTRVEPPDALPPRDEVGRTGPVEAQSTSLSRLSGCQPADPGHVIAGGRLEWAAGVAGRPGLDVIRGPGCAVRPARRAGERLQRWGGGPGFSGANNMTPPKMEK